MQRLNKLWQIANTASQVVELARSSETFRFNVETATTFTCIPPMRRCA